MRNKNSHQYSKKKLEENKQKQSKSQGDPWCFKMKPQALSTPSDFSEYTVKKLSRLQDSAIRHMAFTKIPQC